MEKAMRNDRMAVERWRQACEAGCLQSNYRRERGLTETRDDYFVDGVQWADEHPKETLWRSVDEWPKDGERILMKLDNGKYQATVWEEDGKGFNSCFAEINFGGGAMMRLPIEYKVVAWRPLADVINEYNDHGVCKREASQAGEGYALMERRVEDLPLSVRTVNILKAGDINTAHRDGNRNKGQGDSRLRNHPWHKASEERPETTEDCKLLGWFGDGAYDFDIIKYRVRDRQFCNRNGHPLLTAGLWWRTLEKPNVEE